MLDGRWTMGELRNRGPTERQNRGTSGLTQRRREKRRDAENDVHWAPTS